MKLSEWAARNGVHYQTAWTWAPGPRAGTETGDRQQDIGAQLALG
ncbi:hypothetical protein [Streptomyces sp. TE5632]